MNKQMDEREYYRQKEEGVRWPGSTIIIEDGIAAILSGVAPDVEVIRKRREESFGEGQRAKVIVHDNSEGDHHEFTVYLVPIEEEEEEEEEAS